MSAHPQQPSRPSRRRFLKGSAATAALLGAPALLAAADATPKPAASPAPEPAKPTPPKPADTAAATPKPAGPPSPTTEPTRLRIAIVGTGGQGRHDMRNLLAIKERVVALCDVDENMIAQTQKAGGDATSTAKTYTDYRKLLDNHKDYDAVLIATPDHWHAALATAFIKAGKHVYCEKPLTHSIAEARALRDLVKANPKVVTQMGNQGSAEPSMRRSVELIRAGVLGQVRNIYAFLDAGGFPHGQPRPTAEDPIPPGLNWDMWCGPRPYRPYKAGAYHAFAWRGWLDFGSGQLADFTCHTFNTAMRALNLTYPTKIEVVDINGAAGDGECYAKSNQLKFHFPARPAADPVSTLDPLTIHYSDGGPIPNDDILKDVIARYALKDGVKDEKKIPKGCLIVGEKGSIWSNPWNSGALIRLEGEDKLRDILQHEATKSIPQTLPRKINHFQEWVNACRGEGRTWSHFEFGGHLTEIGLAGVLALRMGHTLDWDGPNMRATNAPSADRIIHTENRKSWL